MYTLQLHTAVPPTLYQLHYTIMFLYYITITQKQAFIVMEIFK